MISGEHNFYKKITVGILVISTILCLIHPTTSADAEGFQKIDPNNIPDALMMMASVAKANYDMIKTLQGKVIFEDMVVYRGSYAAGLVKEHAGITITEPNEIGQRAEGTTEFKIDFRKNLFSKSMNRPKPIEYIDLDKGAPYISVEGGFEQTKIISNEYELESSPYTRKKDGTIMTRVAHKRVRRNPGLITDDSDPRIGFNIGRPVWELLTQFSDSLRSYYAGDINTTYDVMLERKKTEKGVIYRMQITKPGASQYFERFTLESQKSFNPTYIEVKNDKGITVSEITTEFSLVQDVFLSTKRHVLQYDGNDGRLRRSSNTTFDYTQVNRTLPENTFSLNNLGLKNGDKFINEIEGKEYKYQDANLVFVADINEKPKQPKPQNQ